MARFANGTYAWAVCAHCTFRAPYNDLVVEEGTGFLVHDECADELRKPLVAKVDAIQLRKPQPDLYVELEEGENDA
jgi:hypothetical protein